MAECFFQIYGGNSFETKKPDPLGAQTLIREAGVAPEETVMVGDSQVDVLTARNAGAWSIGVTYRLAPQTLDPPAGRIGGYAGRDSGGAGVLRERTIRIFRFVKTPGSRRRRRAKLEHRP